MKFAKGILSETDEANTAKRGTIRLGQPEIKRNEEPVAPAAKAAVVRTPVAVENDRLFQTVDESARSGKKYLVLLLAVSLVIAIGGSAAWYAMRPGIGDQVTAPRGLEQAVRDHFFDREKRESTDITFYVCNGFYWARVGVTTRSDIPNPVWRVGTYSARASMADEKWTISAAPAANPETLSPCS